MVAPVPGPKDNYLNCPHFLLACYDRPMSSLYETLTSWFVADAGERLAAARRPAFLGAGLVAAILLAALLLRWLA